MLILHRHLEIGIGHGIHLTFRDAQDDAFTRPMS
jgi:hypothetical protein